MSNVLTVVRDLSGVASVVCPADLARIRSGYVLPADGDTELEGCWACARELIAAIRAAL